MARDKVKDAQSQLPDWFTVGALRAFQHEFRDYYNFRDGGPLLCTVGPMETFLGYLVQSGRITITTPQETT